MLSIKCLVLCVVHLCIVRSAPCNLCVLSILYIMCVQCVSCVESVLCSCTGCVLSFLCGNSVPFVRVLALWYRFACCLFVIRPYFSVCCLFCSLCAVRFAYCLCNVSLLCCVYAAPRYVYSAPSVRLLSVRCPSVYVSFIAMFSVCCLFVCWLCAFRFCVVFVLSVLRIVCAMSVHCVVCYPSLTGGFRFTC